MEEIILEYMTFPVIMLIGLAITFFPVFLLSLGNLTRHRKGNVMTQEIENEIKMIPVLIPHLGVKIIKSAPMTLGEYNNYRGWTIPADEDPEKLGYLVEYAPDGNPNHKNHDGYISWTPKEAHDLAYRKTDGLTFGLAVEAMKKGLRIARQGWNGKGMFLYYVPENKYPASRNEHGTMLGVFPDDMVPYGAYIAMKTAQENVIPWLASQTDVLAEDWCLVD